MNSELIYCDYTERNPSLTTSVLMWRVSYDKQ